MEQSAIFFWILYNDLFHLHKKNVYMEWSKDRFYLLENIMIM
jgi:hypothetical protein